MRNNAARYTGSTSNLARHVEEVLGEVVQIAALRGHRNFAEIHLVAYDVKVYAGYGQAFAQLASRLYQTTEALRLGNQLLTPCQVMCPCLPLLGLGQ